jgi:hypothetical protein
MKLDTDPFPVDVIELGEKKILVRMDQDETTKGKNVVISDELHNRMIKPRSPEVGVWKENVARRLVHRVNPTLDLLIEKYLWQQQQRGMQ